MDQKALKWLLEAKTLNKRQQRAIDTLQDFDISIEWIPGSWNTIADLLSRRRHTEEKAVQVQIISTLTLGNDSPTIQDEIPQETPNSPELKEIIEN